MTVFFFPDNKIINTLGKIIILSLINVLHTVFIFFFYIKTSYASLVVRPVLNLLVNMFEFI